MVYILKPNNTKVLELNVGDLALSPYGQYKEVTEVAGRGVDPNGRPFVVFYVKNGPSSTISQSYHAGELVVTMPITAWLSSEQVRRLNSWLSDGSELRMDETRMVSHSWMLSK